MKVTTRFGMITLLVVLAIGCNKKTDPTKTDPPPEAKNDPDSLMTEYVGNINSLIAAIEKKEPSDSIKAVAAKLKSTTDKLENLDLSDEEKTKLLDRHKTRVEETMTRLAAVMRTADEATQKILFDSMSSSNPKPPKNPRTTNK